MEEIVGFLLGLVAFFASYGVQAAIVFGAMLVIAVPGLGVLLAVRAGWRRLSPYKEPEYGAVGGFRDWLEAL